MYDEHVQGTLPAIGVRPHTRSRPKLPAALGDGFATMRIGRRTVTIDTSDFRPGAGYEAVVLFQDGRIGIETVADEPEYPRQTFAGRRTAWAPWRDAPTMGRGVKTRGAVVVLGRLVRGRAVAIA